MKRQKLEKYLIKMGCILLREGSNHSIWQNPINKKQASISRHTEIVNLMCKTICKQLDLPYPW
jgi:mRNA interferase HicA